MIKVLLTIFILTLFPAIGRAKSFTIKNINIVCDQTNVCRKFEDKFNSLKNISMSPRQLRDKLRQYLFDNSIATFSYQVLDTTIGKILKVNIKGRKIIDKISIKLTPSTISTDGLKNLLPYYVDEFYNNDLDAEAEARISKFMVEGGIADPKIKIEKKIEDGTIQLNFKVTFENVLKIKKVEINYTGKANISYIRKKLRQLEDEIYNKKEISILISEILKDLFNEGYFHSELSLLQPKYENDGSGIVLKFDFILNQKYYFSFFGNKILSRKTLLNSIKNTIKNQGSTIEVEDIISEIQLLYNKKGYYYNEIKYQYRDGKTKNNEEVTTFFFDIKEGTKIKISSLTFQGNRLIDDKRLNKVLSFWASDLVGNGYLDEAFLEKFSKSLRSEYLKKGFIASKISAPIIEKKKESKTATVIYRIKESLICELKGVNYLSSVPDELKDLITKGLSNKIGSVFNITKIEEELEQILNISRENGYYFAKIVNKDDPALLKFSRDYKHVEMVLDLDLGKKTFFNDFQISGNIKSKERVILRESIFKKGDLLKYSMVEFFKARISSLALFKNVKITPIVVSSVENDKSKQLIDLLIEVKERDTISIALGPGFRTDAGAKLSTRLRFLNIGGMNRRVNLLANANYRITLDTLDENRQEENLRILEYRFRVDFEEPYFFHLPLEFDISGAIARSRFFSFDADILTGVMAFSKDFTAWFSASIKYQYDNIYQFNATLLKDTGSFRVGAITPSVNLDFRDNKTLPRRGGWFGLSLEFATPGLGSINIENFEVEYLKLVSRNKGYLKLSKNWGLAASLTLGYEKNFADDLILDDQGDPIYFDEGRQVLTKGYIPSIKVFRAEGIDIVRGYQETEINRLPNTGQDILDWFVNNTAYMAVFKFEARRYISDNFIIASFFDAGRVFVNKFNILNLRTSAGISFKLVTPVGSLDLDFGVKLKKETYPDGVEDSFGRIHLLIGYF